MATWILLFRFGMRKYGIMSGLSLEEGSRVTDCPYYQEPKVKEGYSIPLDTLWVLGGLKLCINEIPTVLRCLIVDDL